MLNIIKQPVGPFQVNCYILVAGQTCVVIDPGGDADRILTVLSERALRVTGYLLTHGHMDHISALKAVTNTHPAPAYLHESDSTWAFTDRNSYPPYYETPEQPENSSSPLLAELSPDSFCLPEMNIIHTPGHTPGSVCFYFPEQHMLFSGDTLFRQSIGRTDFPGGNHDHMLDSLQRLKQLPGETRVYPGHGPETCLDEECRTNPYLLS